MDHKNNIITPQAIQNYCNIHSSPPSDYLIALAQNEKIQDRARMLSGHYLGKLLSLLSKMLRPSCIVEVGTFIGYGTICLAEGLTDGGHIISIEKDQRHYEIAKEMLATHPLSGKIKLVHEDATITLEQIDEEIDLLFLDAAKRKYIEHYELAFPKIRSGGVILADNVLWKGTVINDETDKLGEGLKAFNTHILNDDRVEKILLPIDDGLHLIRKK